jgi:rhamnose transport system substrate-binding protein
MMFSKGPTPLSPALRRAAAVVAAVTSLTLAATACGGTTKNSTDKDSGGSATSTGAKADPTAPLKKGLKIAFLPKQVNNPYFTVADKGGQKALAQLGSSYRETGPNSATDTSAQVSYVNTLTQQQVDAIAVSAQDPGALCTALKQAMRNGIKIVTYDSDTNPGCRNVFISQASAEAIGRTQVQQLGRQIGYKGEIAVLSAA